MDIGLSPEGPQNLPHIHMKNIKNTKELQALTIQERYCNVGVSSSTEGVDHDDSNAISASRVRAGLS